MKAKISVAGHEPENPYKLKLKKFTFCPVCKKSDYSIIEGCKNCLYKNRYIGIFQNLSENPEAQAAIIDRVIKMEGDADRSKIIQILNTNLSKDKERFCPKCRMANYEILIGCSKCGYLNPWTDKVIAAFACNRSYVPISEMYIFEVEANR